MTAQAELPSASTQNIMVRTDQEQQLVKLISAIAQGDQEALSVFYDQTYRLVFGLVLRIVGNRETAEEVTTDIYLQVWRQAAKFDLLRGTALSWLMTIARSRSLDRLRASPYVRRETESLDTVSHYAAPDATPEKISLHAERSRIVHHALKHLTPDQRALIEAAYFEGLSQSELAGRFALPLGTVKTRVRAGMMVLKKHFTEVLPCA